MQSLLVSSALAVAFAFVLPTAASATTGGCVWPTIALSLYFTSAGPAASR